MSAPQWMMARLALSLARPHLPSLNGKRHFINHLRPLSSRVGCLQFPPRGSYLCLSARQCTTTMAGKSVSYKVVVKTGDKKRAGTDANVRVILHDDKGQKTKAAKLDNFLRDDFERGQIDKFTVKDVVDLDEIHQIELWRDDAGMYSDWFCDCCIINGFHFRSLSFLPTYLILVALGGT